MNARPALRGIAEAAESLRDRTSAAELARLTDHATSTITRRDASGLPVAQWPGLDLLQLARIDADLRRAVIAYLEHAPVVSGDSGRVIEDLCAEAECSGALASEIRRPLADGKLTAQEIDGILTRLDSRQRADAALARDLRAQRRGVRP